MANEIKITIALLPPPDIFQWLAGLSRQVNQAVKHPPFVLDDQRQPHLSLAISEIRVESLESVNRLAQDRLSLFANINLITANVETLHLGKHDWTMLMVENSELLRQLNVELMDYLAKIEVQAGDYRRFGSYEHYQPHFTLGVNQGNIRLSLEKKQFVPERIAVCELGEYATCSKIISKWDLIRN